MTTCYTCKHKTTHYDDQPCVDCSNFNLYEPIKETHMNDLSTLPYAKWLEESLQNIVGKPVKAICIMTKFDTDDIGTGYWDCSVADKVLFAGFLQQDAMLDTMKANGYLEEDEEDEDLNG